MTSLPPPNLYERPPGMRERLAAGGVVARLDDTGRIWLAYAFEREWPVPVLPKGGVKKRETVEEGARREIEEETGLAEIDLLGELGTLERQDWNQRHWKVTHYFLFATTQMSGIPSDPKHPPFQWVPLDDRPELAWPEQERLIAGNFDLIREAVSEWGAARR